MSKQPSAIEAPIPDHAAHLHGFDGLRALLSVCVVGVHLGFLYPSKIFSRATWQEHTFVPSDAVNFYLLLLAVPAFYLMSCMLVVRKDTADGMWAKTGRLLLLGLFWSFLLNLYYFGIVGALKAIPRAPVAFVLYVVSGFNTPYYFFIWLPVLMLISHGVRYWSKTSILLSILASVAIVSLLPLAAMRWDAPALALYYLPLPFLPYPFVAVACMRLPLRRAPAACGLLVALGAILSLLDWHVYKSPIFFESGSSALPTYARPSLIAWSAAAVILAKCVQNPMPDFVRFMSANSLALYCLHPFAILPVKAITRRMHWGSELIWLEIWVQLLLVLAICYALSVVLLPKILRKELFR